MVLQVASREVETGHIVVGWLLPRPDKGWLFEDVEVRLIRLKSKQR